MSNWLKALGLAAVVTVVAVMVPLYGDPRSSSVEHGEWARLLLRALDMERAATPDTPDARVFATLSWKNSLAFRADDYLRGEGVDVVGAGTARKVVATAQPGEVAYPLAVVRGGDYRLRARMAGNPATPASAEITALGRTGAPATFTLVASSLTGWVEAGPAHLDPGAYTASIQLPEGTSLDQVEVAPPCTEAIEPIGGWRARAVTQADDLAVTVVKAIDQESELPPAASPIEVSASSLKTTGGAAASLALLGASGGDGLWLRAGPRGLQATVFLELSEAGLYSVSVLGEAGGGQSWKADACRKAVWCGSTAVPPAPATAAAWHPLMTAAFGAGRHFFSVTLSPGASVQRLRAERKKDGAADYVATLRRLGFDVGPAGPVSRARAADAMRPPLCRARATDRAPWAASRAGTRSFRWPRPRRRRHRRGRRRRSRSSPRRSRSPRRAPGRSLSRRRRGRPRRFRPSRPAVPSYLRSRAYFLTAATGLGRGLAGRLSMPGA
ncbi:MAG: hypothetical protein DMF82_17085 [Acidobacteria bacterium]|nr:MAG: hypothetical protein DMF82_17085 [Acidobacteriota bacterium]